MMLKISGFAALAATLASAQTQNSASFVDMEASNSGLVWNLQQHSCNCPDIYGLFAIGGTAVNDDVMDRICQEFRQCNNCAKKEGSCATDYDTKTFSWTLGTAGADSTCVAGQSTCNQMKCECHMTFINDMTAYTGNYTAVSANTTDCTAAPGNARSCCKNAAGEWKMFDDSVNKCENGVISPAGKIPTVSTCNGKEIDVTMFVDGSGSVSRTNFYNAVIPFCNDFATALKLSQGGIHMQFFQWSRYGRLEFGYQTDAATFASLTASISYYSSVTYTYENLKQCYEDHIQNSGRAAAKKVIVNITDGKPTGDTVGNKVRDYVRDVLTPAGVVHIVVGVGSGIPWSTLVNMSTIKNTAIHQGETTFLAGLNRDAMSAIGNQIGEEVCR